MLNNKLSFQFRYRTHRVIHGAFIGAALCILGVAGTCQALSGLSQSYYASDANVTPGALVSTSINNEGGVELATDANRSRIAGVISSKPLINLDATSDATTGSNPNMVNVIVSGLTQILVTDYNGAVRTGDKITVSPIAGIGAKATNSTTIVGTAQSDSGHGAVTKRTVKKADGAQQIVTISMVDVQVAVAAYTPPQTSSIIPAFVQNFANTIARHNVSPARVFIAVILTVLMFGSVIAVIYAAVKSSIISIGRNPLSATAIQQSLLKICAITLVIICSGTVVVYLIVTT